jgi:hypothetical protein
LGQSAWEETGPRSRHGRVGEYPGGMKTQERIGSSSAAKPRGQVVRIPDHAQSPEGALFPPDDQGWRTTPPPPRRDGGRTLGQRAGELLGAITYATAPSSALPKGSSEPPRVGSPATPSPQPAHRGATPAESPRALHHRGTPERPPSSTPLGGSSQEPLTGSSPTLLLGGTHGRPTRRPPPRPLLGGVITADAMGRPSTARLLGASPGDLPRAGPRALSPGRQPGRDPSGPPPPLAPQRGPPGRLLLGGSTPSPSPRGFIAAPSSEGAAPEPLTGSDPDPSLLGESGEGHFHGMQTGQPLLGEATSGRIPPKPHPQAGSSEPTQGATSQGAPPPRSPKRHPPGGSSEPLFGSRFRSPRPLRPPRRLSGARVPWRAPFGVAPRSLPSRPSPERISEGRPPTGLSGKD